MYQIDIYISPVQMVNESNSFEQWKKPGYLLYIGDYTTQLCGDYNKPL